MMAQEKLIRDSLNMYNKSERNHVCKISTKTLKDILTKKYFTGADMKRVSCLFNTLIMQSGTHQSKSSLYMPDSVKEWLKIMIKINTSSVNGFAYITDIYTEDIQVVIKVPKYTGYDDILDMIREYYIGLMAVNKLRYIVPTFVYTLSAFVCNNTYDNGKDVLKPESCTLPTSPFLILEKIPGNSVHSAMTNNEITFNVWLVLFAQLLLGLEVAQREVNFTHFDLHAGNVMIRTEQNDIDYNVPLDTMTYKVHNTKQVPVMIDFGLSSVKVDSVTIGNKSQEYNEFGILKCMVPGYDVYKFLCACAYYSKDIMELFTLYGTDDPYDVVNTGIDKAKNEYFAKATFSKVATYTPLMFFKLLYAHPKYHKILKPFITVENRKEFISIQYPEEDHTEHCIPYWDPVGPHSYILTEYNIHILTRYNKFLKSKKIQAKIDTLRSTNSPEYIKIDLFQLEKVFNILLPDQHTLDKAVSDILDVQIAINSNNEIIPLRGALRETLREALREAVAYQVELEPYLQLYYTILEINEYTAWVDKFEKSELFRFYKANVDTNNRAMRWSITLKLI